MCATIFLASNVWDLSARSGTHWSDEAYPESGHESLSMKSVSVSIANC